MGTRSLIAAKMNDGTVKEIYCHWDGYLDGVGKTLQQNYENIQLIEELMLLGNLSSLGKVVGVKHPFMPSRNDSITEFQNKYGHMTTAYHRDRGEKLEITTYASVDEWKEKGGWNVDAWQEYVYFWDGEQWTVTGYFKFVNNDFVIEKEDYVTINEAIKIEKSANRLYDEQYKRENA